MALRYLLTVLLVLFSASCALGSSVIEVSAFDKRTQTPDVATASLSNTDGHTDSSTSESQNTQATIHPDATTTAITTSASRRQGKSLLSNRSSRDVKTKVPEAPEELPTPEALTIPVPSFLANLFSGGPQQRAHVPPPARRLFRQSQRQFPPQHDIRERRPHREAAQREPVRRKPVRREPLRREPVHRARQRDSEDYHLGSDPVDNRDDKRDEPSSSMDINENYDFISETSYAPRAKRPEKDSIHDSDVFDRPPNYEDRENNYPFPTDHFGEIEEKEFGSRVNFRENEVANFEASQGNYRNEGNDPLESYYDDLNTESDYDSRNYKPDSSQREGQFPNHRYQAEESAPLFGGLFSAFNPLNYFRTPVTEPPLPHRFGSRTRPGRRSGSAPRYPPHQIDELTASPSATDYFDFSSLEPYESRESGRRKLPEFSLKSRNIDHRLQRTKTPRGQRLFRDEIPLTGQRFQENFPNSKRNRNAGSGRPFKRNTERRPSVDDFSPIVDDEFSFSKEPGRPIPPPRYDPRSTSFGTRRGHSVRNPTAVINRSNELSFNIPSNEIQYKNIPALQNDPRLEPFKYKEDFPLRDDLYVGKDGNIYLKGENTQESEPATLTDSDAFLGLHMYGMDHPLYQEVSKSRTTLIGSESSDSIAHTNIKQGRNFSTLKPVLNNAQFTETKDSFRQKSPRVKTTAHRRPPTFPPTALPTSPTASLNPFLTTPGNVTPHMSNFAKTLIKVKKAADPDSRSVQHDDLKLSHDLKD